MNKQAEKISIGVVGCGNWGKNHARTLAEIPAANIQYLCDSSKSVIEKNVPSSISGKRTESFEEVLSSNVSALVIATPVNTHFELARAALNAGKHVLVEKPICVRSSEAEELMQIAEKQNCILMVGHLMWYHPTLKILKNRIDQGEFGKIFFLRSERLNTGVVRSFENAWESLAPHDLSIVLWLLGEDLESLKVHEGSFLQKGISDKVDAFLNFKNNVSAHISVSWLDPLKVRRLTVVGEKKMAVFNDVPNGGGLEIFETYAVKKNNQFTFNLGPVEKIPLSTESALKNELEHFINCIANKQQPVTDGQNGYTVLKWMEEGNKQIL